MEKIAKRLGLTEEEAKAFLSACQNIPYPGVYDVEIAAALQGKDFLSEQTLNWLQDGNRVGQFKKGIRRFPAPYYGLAPEDSPYSQVKMLLYLLEIYPDDVNVAPHLVAALTDEAKAQELSKIFAKVHLFEQTRPQGFHDAFWTMGRYLD